MVSEQQSEQSSLDISANTAVSKLRGPLQGNAADEALNITSERLCPTPYDVGASHSSSTSPF